MGQELQSTSLKTGGDPIFGRVSRANREERDFFKDVLRDYFRAGKSQSKLNRGRDPILGSFTLQKRTRLKLSGGGGTSFGRDKDGNTIIASSGKDQSRAVDSKGSPLDKTTNLKIDKTDPTPNQLRSNKLAGSLLDNLEVGLAEGARRLLRNEPQASVPSPGQVDYGLRNAANIVQEFQISKLNATFAKRKLEERSHLVFEFDYEGGKKRAYLPFIENIQISESNKSNLATYSLLGRAGQIFSYQGADSRSIKIKFSFKLLHLIQTYKTDGIDSKFFTHFLNFSDKTSEISNPINHASIHKNYYDKKLQTNNLFQKDFKDILNKGQINFLNGGNPKETLTDFAINTIIYWINLVRSSTKNNSANTTFGPPIIRVTHGPMYNAIPCVAQDYSITIDEAAGYDAVTMFPRGINIDLDLLEVRTGNFGKFKSFSKTNGDNNVGWEAVFEENNMDPYNGLISR